MMKRRKGDRVAVFDTTLRDGEQSPGASMNVREKLAVAAALRDLGVDVIEAGFPVSSPGDFAAVQAIARQVEGCVIAGLARCVDADIDRAWEALRDAARKRLHVFLATSPIHRRQRLRMGKEEVLAAAVRGVRRARAYCEDVEFSAEDASRTELDFLLEVVEAVIAAGAGTVNIPDTVGYSLPSEFAERIRYLKRLARGIEQVTLSVHCHDDLGLAVANSLAAVEAGAHQVECTVNGIGERAGNCSLEELVMALKTRQGHFGRATGIRTRQLHRVCALVSGITGMPIPRNKAVVGENAFAHESGIHQHGVLLDSETYEIMKPEDVGMPPSRLVLGKHSGRHAFRRRLEGLGWAGAPGELEALFAAFKRLADRRKEVGDADLGALLALTRDEVQAAGAGIPPLFPRADP